MFGDWLYGTVYGHFEACVLDLSQSDQSRPNTPQGRCLGTSSAGVSQLDLKVGSQREAGVA